MKINLIFVSFFWMLGLQMKAQIETKPANEYLLNIANTKFKQGDFYDAIPDFETLANQNPCNTEIVYKYGVCLVEAGKNQLVAIPLLKAAFKAGNGSSAYYLGKVYYGYMQFDSAHFYLSLYLKMKPKNDPNTVEAEKLLDHLFDAMLLMNDNNGLIVSHLDKNINSSFADYSPVVRADNAMLYFTSRREDSKGKNKDEMGQYYEDIYAAKLVDSVFEQAENVGSPLNSNEHDATVALSADGNTIIIYRTDPYSGSGDLFFSKNEGTKWANPIKMGLHINSLYQETSASLSVDGNTLFFSSNKPGGLGGFDIYKSSRGKNGVWGAAINLGNKINSKWDEESPCISADSKILYFSSKGHKPNMGGYDVYKAETDPSGKWQKPINMGFPINTLKDDLYFTVDAKAQNGYISSNRIDSEGDLDIYQFTLKQKEPEVTLFKGVVKDMANRDYTDAEIEIWDRGTNKMLFKSNSNAASGQFLLVLPNEKNLKVVFEKGNAIFTEIIDAKTDGKFHEIFKIIELEPR